MRGSTGAVASISRTPGTAVLRRCAGSPTWRRGSWPHGPPADPNSSSTSAPTPTLVRWAARNTVSPRPWRGRPPTSRLGGWHLRPRRHRSGHGRGAGGRDRSTGQRHGRSGRAAGGRAAVSVPADRNHDYVVKYTERIGAMFATWIASLRCSPSPCSSHRRACGLDRPMMAEVGVLRQAAAPGPGSNSASPACIDSPQCAQRRSTWLTSPHAW